MLLNELLRSVVVTKSDLSWEEMRRYQISAVASDSRKVVPGCLFVCIRGVHADAHDYIGDAVSRGASVVVTEKGTPFQKIPGAVYIESDDTHSALAKIWSAWYGFPSSRMRIIAVTGTNGKTSTTYILRAIMRAAGYRVGLIGTVRCLIDDSEIDFTNPEFQENHASTMTTPDPEVLYNILAKMRDAGMEYVIMEASSHAIDQRKLDGMKFDAAIFTNLSPEHLDYHGTMEQYFAAKAALFKKVPLAVINADSEYAPKLLITAPHCRYIRCSAGSMLRSKERQLPKEDLDYYAADFVSHGIRGVEYSLLSKQGAFRIRSNIPGEFTVYNTMLASACALEFGVDPVTIKEALKALPGVTGRMERVKIDATKCNFSVFIDYAHTPEAMKNVLCTLREIREPGQKITVLFGCGGDRDRSKRKVMGSIASQYADFVIVTSDNSRSEDPAAIIADIMRGVEKEKPYIVLPNRRDAIEYAIRHASDREIILLCGKGHETYEINKEGIHPFDEKKIIAEIIGEMSC